MNAELAWQAEETGLNAFPGLRHVLLRGWLLRLSGGWPRRTNNSATPLRADCADIASVIDAVAAVYHGNGLPVLVRLPSLARPGGEAALAGRGYASEGDSCVIYGAIGDLAAAPDPAVELSPCPTPEWLAAMAALQGYDRGRLASYRRVLRAVALPAAFAGLRADGRLVSLAYAAVHDRLLCYESVVTAADCRNRGFARRAIGALACWGASRGAAGACLQVEAANAAARHLYRRFGLATDLYRYCYWREPAPSIAALPAGAANPG